VLIEWQPERYYDRVIGEDRRRAMFAEVDLHGMNDRVDLGEGFRDVIYETAEAYPDWRAEIRDWHDNWIELATRHRHSVKLMRTACRAKGVPVFALTNFGIESFAYARRSTISCRVRPRLRLGSHAVIKPDPASTRWSRRIAACRPGAFCSPMTAPTTSPRPRRAGGRRISSTGPRAGPTALVAHGLLTARRRRHERDHRSGPRPRRSSTGWR
jgi:2-haloacid dehalogenase